MSTVPSTIRVVEVLAALSLTTDLASGLTFEKGLRTCLVGEAFGRELGLGEADRRGVFQAALLRGIGCTSHSSENAAMFVDDVAFQAMLRVLDPARPDVFRAQMSQFGQWQDATARPFSPSGSSGMRRKSVREQRSAAVR